MAPGNRVLPEIVKAIHTLHTGKAELSYSAIGEAFGRGEQWAYRISKKYDGVTGKPLEEKPLGRRKKGDAVQDEMISKLAASCPDGGSKAIRNTLIEYGLTNVVSARTIRKRIQMRKVAETAASSGAASNEPPINENGKRTSAASGSGPSKKKKTSDRNEISSNLPPVLRQLLDKAKQSGSSAAPPRDSPELVAMARRIYEDSPTSYHILLESGLPFPTIAALQQLPGTTIVDTSAQSRAAVQKNTGAPVLIVPVPPRKVR
ncbi:hypothetical protein BV898_04940 [Hypsibius exemplaris]|uniref:Uncharacterized protein n=1 Tax=Hypsibius exemplaris TaxID=2072580 RepID=A0A1W0X149_HYPEX|nr:hypothetical protein BV898_04940 [Hypsibius exemplaris]